MMDVRTGEQAKRWFRGERFAQVNDQWFFTKRGFAIDGPYQSKEDAESGLKKYINNDSSESLEICSQ